MPRRIVGIDPGLAGGVGVLDMGDDGTETATLHLTPTLTVRRGRRVRREHDVAAMRDLLADVTGAGEAGGVEVVLEEQQAMPARLRGRTQGVASSFRTGLGFGLWLGLVTAARVRCTLVRPVTWKQAVGLRGADKRASRLRCGALFPTLAPIAARDEGPAEALLIAWAASRPRPAENTGPAGAAAKAPATAEGGC